MALSMRTTVSARSLAHRRRYTAEERRAFANHINDVLKDDAALKGALPMNPETNDLFTVRFVAGLGKLTTNRSSVVAFFYGA